MAKTKLVSVRISEDILQMIEERVIGRYTLSRSSAIESALRMIFQQLSDSDLQLAFRNQYCRDSSTVVTLREVQYVGGGHFKVCDPERGLVEF